MRKRPRRVYSLIILLTLQCMTTNIIRIFYNFAIRIRQQQRRKENTQIQALQRHTRSVDSWERQHFTVCFSRSTAGVHLTFFSIKCSALLPPTDSFPRKPFVCVRYLFAHISNDIKKTRISHWKSIYVYARLYVEHWNKCYTNCI